MNAKKKQQLFIEKKEYAENVFCEKNKNINQKWQKKKMELKRIEFDEKQMVKMLNKRVIIETFQNQILIMTLIDWDDDKIVLQYQRNEEGEKSFQDVSIDKKLIKSINLKK